MIEDPKSNWHGMEFPEPKGPASLILQPWRSWIKATLNCFWNPKVTVNYLASDGVSTISKDASIIMGPKGWHCTLDLATGNTPLQSGVGGIRYAVPIEVVSGRAYSKGERVHCQPTHALVVTGIRARANSSGPLVQSEPGWYIALQNVPAQSTVGGNLVWDLPQFPYPEPDNIDDARNFWEWMPDNFC